MKVLMIALMLLMMVKTREEEFVSRCYDLIIIHLHDEEQRLHFGEEPGAGKKKAPRIYQRPLKTQAISKHRDNLSFQGVSQ